MMNGQNIRSNSPTEIPPSQRVRAFKDLPPQTQESLLRLQNSDGDFLKISSGETERRIALLVLVLLTAAGLAAIAADSAPDLKRIVAFSADALLLLCWFIYLVRGIFNAFKTPLRNRIYITPTLVIETLDGTIRHRELKDANEIVINELATDIGRRSRLDVTFDDGDAYRFYIPGMANSEQISLMRQWRGKAAKWQREAVGASKRGDTDYLKSRDVFPTLSDTSAPVLQGKRRTRRENLLLIITVALIVLNGGFIYFSSR